MARLTPAQMRVLRALVDGTTIRLFTTRHEYRVKVSDGSTSVTFPTFYGLKEAGLIAPDLTREDRNPATVAHYRITEAGLKAASA